MFHFDNTLLEAQENLAEAGGLASWLKRAFTGMDGELVSELREELKSKITTAEEKANALKDLDKFIREGKGITGSQIAFHVLVGGWMTVLLTAVIRTSTANSVERAEYIKVLGKIREEVSKIKVKD